MTAPPPRTPPDPDASPIFVVGWGRTGTSLLRSMLNAHPRIYLAQEANLYMWTMRRLPGTSPRARLEAYLRSFSFAWLGVSADVVRERFPDGARPDQLSEVYAFVLRKAAERRGAARYGDKNPQNADYLEHIFADYENPRVIRMMRDPRAVAVSHTRMPFSTPSVMLLSNMMKRTPDLMRPYEDRLHTVRLEDLVSDPRGTMERLLEFLGEPWDDAVLDHVAHIPENDGIPFPWLEPGGARPEPRPPSWPRSLSPAWIRLIEKDTRETMERFGYEPATLDAEPTAHETRMALLRDVPVALSFLARATGTLLRLGVPPWVDAERGQRMLHSLNPSAWKGRSDWTLPTPPPV